MRIEQDFLGERELPQDAKYGINALRAKDNFPDDTAFHKEWYCAMGKVKLACYETYMKFKQSILREYSDDVKLPFELIEDDVMLALKKAALEVSKGEWFSHFIVPAIQGGAGTSINMNVNEILSNVALMTIGKSEGQYQFVDPFEHANIYQSTNDVVPTALKISIIELLKKLEEAINRNRLEVEKLESNHRNELRQGYTQMQAAVPSSYDKLFSTYSNALSRDWWRVSKCFERIKEVNIGGGALGTGLSIPRFFIMDVVNVLQRLTGLPITRSENLSDNTANLDSFVEVHAILKAHAVNLEKMVSDIRLISSDLFLNKEVSIPQKQVGSSIMPGKVNPVIPEFVISCAHKIYSNDVLVSNLSGQGCLDLNAYLPTIGHAVLESLKLLIRANETISKNMLKEMVVQKSSSAVYFNPAITTAITPYIGYHHAAILAKEMHVAKISVFEANRKHHLIEENRLKQLLEPEQLMKFGFRIGDVLDDISS